MKLIEASESCKVAIFVNEINEINMNKTIDAIDNIEERLQCVIADSGSVT